MKLFEELKWRGLIDNISHQEIEDKINNGQVTFYIGTDPTADSLHIGHLSSMLVAKRLANHGHKPIILVGGATGLIGDPRPTSERQMISYEELENNYKALESQIKKLFGFEMVNNYEWSQDINFIDYLRDYGKYFSLNYMLSKEVVKSRLETGITYTEFSYMIMQALDFLHLYENKGVTLQLGGSDQWGNITAGIELARKKKGVELYALSMPLITKADGTKFGKSEGGAIWLDKNKTSSYELYQFLINSEDSKVIDYLKKLTFLTPEKIILLEEKNKVEPHLREAHKTLAKEVITFLHGEEEYEKALKISEVLFSGDFKSLELEELVDAIKGIERFKLELNKSIIEVLTENNICKSNREARELIDSGAISINGDKIMDKELLISRDNLLYEKFLIVRKGKKKYYVGELS